MKAEFRQYLETEMHFVDFIHIQFYYEAELETGDILHFQTKLNMDELEYACYGATETLGRLVGEDSDDMDLEETEWEPYYLEIIKKPV